MNIVSQKTTSEFAIFNSDVKYEMLQIDLVEYSIILNTVNDAIHSVKDSFLNYAEEDEKEFFLANEKFANLLMQYVRSQIEEELDSALSKEDTETLYERNRAISRQS